MTHPYKPGTAVLFKFVRDDKQYILGRVKAIRNTWNKEYFLIKHLNNPEFSSLRNFDEVFLASGFLENLP